MCVRVCSGGKKWENEIQEIVGRGRKTGREDKKRSEVVNLEECERERERRTRGLSQSTALEEMVT